MEEQKTRFNMRLRPKPQFVPIVRVGTTPAERMRKYREGLKLTGEYEEVKRKDAERHKQRRKEPKSEEDLEHIRQMNRIRMKRYREQQKSLGIKKQKPIVKTRKQTVDMRAYWKSKKRESRERLSAQKKRRIKEKDRKRKSDKVDQNDSDDCSASKVRKVQGYSTAEALRKATYRAKKHLPENATKFASTLETIISNATTEQRQELEKLGIMSSRKKELHDVISENVLRKIKEMKRSHYKKDQNARRNLVKLCLSKNYRNIRKVRKNLGLKYSYLMKLCSLREEARGEESDADQEVKDFYMHPNVSTVCTSTRKVKKGKNLFYMNKTLKETHEDFQKSTKQKYKIGKSKFASLRPNNVKVKSKTPLNQCLCDYCINVELKLEALRKHIKCSFKTKYDIINFTMCEKKEKTYHDQKCIFRSCSECGIEVLRRKLEKELCVLEMNWTQWGDVQMGSITTKGLKTMRKSKEDFINDISKEVEFLSKHLFVASWEQSQFKMISANVPNKWVVSVLDFGKNYTCQFQDEPQFLHYGQRQVTVHPVIAYYQCNNCEEMVKYNMVMLSDDIKHDAAAVQQFQTTAYKYLKEEQKLDIQHIVQFTDGCSAQYKSKHPFYNISCFKETFGCTLQRCYYGSRHGKGPGDQIIGVVKSAMLTAVRSRNAVIANAKDAYEFCSRRLSKETKENECEHNPMTFFLVENFSHTTLLELKTVKDTRKFHSVVSVSPGILEVRNLTCFCKFCIDQNFSECVNIEYVEPFKRVTMSLIGNTQKCGHGQTTKRVQRKKQSNATAISSRNETTVKVDEAKTVKVQRKMQDDEKPVTGTMSARRKTASRTNRNETTVKVDEAKTVTTVKVDEAKTVKVQRKMQDDEKPVTGTISARRKTASRTKSVKSKRASDTRDENTILPVDDENKDVTEKILLTTTLDESSSRSDFFENAQRRLMQMENYDNFKVECFYIRQAMKKYEVEVIQPTILNTRLSVDSFSLDLMPDDIEGKTKFPVCVYGDGNCLPRCASLFTGLDHMEVRVRIAIEGVLFDSLYLDNEYLVKGHHNNKNTSLENIYAQYSEEFDPSEVFVPSTVDRIYQREAMSIVKPGNYMGIWQLFSLASILGCSVFSVYPKYGGKNVREDLHRLILPRNNNPRREMKAFIMWSHTRGCDVDQKHWRPNHFVAILPLDESDVTVEHVVEDAAMDRAADVVDAVMDIVADMDDVMDRAADVDGVMDGTADMDGIMDRTADVDDVMDSSDMDGMMDGTADVACLMDRAADVDGVMDRADVDGAIDSAADVTGVMNKTADVDGKMEMADKDGVMDGTADVNGVKDRTADVDGEMHRASDVDDVMDSSDMDGMMDGTADVMDRAADVDGVMDRADVDGAIDRAADVDGVMNKTADVDGKMEMADKDSVMDGTVDVDDVMDRSDVDGAIDRAADVDGVMNKTADVDGKMEMADKDGVMDGTAELNGVNDRTGGVDGVMDRTDLEGLMDGAGGVNGMMDGTANVDGVMNKAVAVDDVMDSSDMDGMMDGTADVMDRAADVDGAIDRAAGVDGLMNRTVDVDDVMERADMDGVMDGTADVNGMMDGTAKVDGVMNRAAKMDGVMDGAADLDGVMDRTDLDGVIDGAADVDGVMDRADLDGVMDKTDVMIATIDRTANVVDIFDFKVDEDSFLRMEIEEIIERWSDDVVDDVVDDKVMISDEGNGGVDDMTAIAADDAIEIKTSLGFSVGSYILVRHGSRLLPAVVTDLQESHVWANFFKKNNKGWSLEETNYTLLFKDIERLLEAPSIAVAGASRFVYKFNKF